MAIVGIVLAGVAVAGTVAAAEIQSNAVSNAANTQANAANKALASQQAIFQQQRTDFAPYQAAGAAAMGRLNATAGTYTGGMPPPGGGAAAAPPPGAGSISATMNGQPYTATPGVPNGVVPGAGQPGSLAPGSTGGLGTGNSLASMSQPAGVPNGPATAQGPGSVPGAGQPGALAPVTSSPVQAPQGSQQLVRMLAPDGTMESIPVSQVSAFQARGAVRLG